MPQAFRHDLACAEQRQSAEEELAAENKVGDNFGYSERAIKDIGSAAISEITQSKSL